MDLALLHRAARAYYVDDLRQADIASELGVSRPTVSKLLAEARRIGMVRFEVLDPYATDAEELAERLASELGLELVRVAPGEQTARGYRGLGDLLGALLEEIGLRRGDVVLVSSGRTTYEVSGAEHLPDLSGVVFAPTVGGQQEPEAWFQTNETVRRLSNRTHGLPRFIFAPAQPSPQLWESLQADPSFVEITDLWSRARVVIVGVGAPVMLRESLTSVLPREGTSLERAVGDVCLHFYDRDGAPVEFPGSELLVRPGLETLRSIPVSVALAAGREKAISIRAGARAGLFRALITDQPTAEAILADAR